MCARDVGTAGHPIQVPGHTAAGHRRRERAVVMENPAASMMHAVTASSSVWAPVFERVSVPAVPGLEVSALRRRA